jgi:DeoR/GlpR family transcriptional regulator of sugar metabolism
MFVHIKAKDGLVRDMSSGAVLNTNQTEFENYLARKSQSKQAKEQIAKQAEEINNIKNEICEIKQMLVALLNK